MQQKEQEKSQQKKTPIITAKKLTKTFADKSVVCDVSFTIEQGRCYGFLGPNGAGKTTTLSLIEGLSPLTSGELSVFGLTFNSEADTSHTLLSNSAKARAKMGIVPQMDNLDPDFNVIENLRIYGRYFKIPSSVLEPRINELLAFMQLSDRKYDKPDNLSGGMKRRLTIARALVNDPELIILDEPTTGLDPQVRHVIWDQLRQLMKSGKTILMTTHYMDEAERLCDELFIMDNGVILDQGPPKAIIEKHVEPFVMEFFVDDLDVMQQLQAKLKKIVGVRLDVHGDTIFCYCRARQPVEDMLALHFENKFSDQQYYFRPCNLEDVFLNMTGRDLRE